MTNDLPPDWTWARLEDLAAAEPRAITDGPFGSNLKTAHYTDSGPGVIRLQNIGDGVFRHDDAHISEEHYMSLVQHSVKAGDLVVASLGETLPRACLVPNWVPPAIVKADCIRVRLHPDLNPSYINFALQRPELRRETATLIKGVGRPRLGLQGIKSLAVPLAPLPQQARIVAAIEERFARLDAAGTSMTSPTRRTAQLLESALQAELRTSDVESQPLRVFLAQPLANGRSVPTAEEHGFPVLRLTCLKDGWVDTSECKQGNFGEIDPRRYRVEPDDFLISRGNGSLHLVGIGGLVPGDARPVAYPDTLIRARVDRTRLRPEFLSVVWNGRIVRRQLESQARTTAGIYKINQSMIGNVLLPAPSVDVQDRVVQRLELVQQTISRLDAGVEQYHRQSAALRRSILSSAFLGQLVPQDPDDEPAPVLLERIASTRASELADA